MWILQSFLIGVTLVSTLRRSPAVYASPVPSMSTQTGFGSGSTVILNARNSSSVSGHGYFADEATTTLSPRQVRGNGRFSLSKTGKAVSDTLDKFLDRGVMVVEGHTFLGVGYAKPEDALPRKGQYININKVKLANDDWNLLTDEIYLLPYLGIPNQNPKNYWSCVVYAKKEKINKIMENMKGRKTHGLEYEMVYEERELHEYPYPDHPPPLYSQESQPVTEFVAEQPVVYFGNEKFPNVVSMRIPKESNQEWQLLASCYETSNGLTKLIAPWNKWKSEVHGWNQRRDLVTMNLH